MLLAAAGLTLKSFWHAQQRPLGFDPHGILAMSLSLPKAHYESDAKQTAFYTQLLERVRGLPRVESAAIGVNVPFDENEWDTSFHITGTPDIPHGKEPSVEVNVVSPDYFRVMKMPILRGRSFSAEDVPATNDGTRSRAVIIDETLAQRFFAGRDPIGQHLDDNQTPKEKAPPLTIVGVVPRTRNEAPGEENVESLNFSQMYFYAAQYAQSESMLLVRVTSGDPLGLVSAIKQQVQALDPEQPISNVATMESNIAASRARAG